MKTFEICEGIKETTKSVIVDLDKYHGRERYYQGTKAGVVLRFSKDVHPDLFKPWNHHYNTVLDLLLAQYGDGEEIKGVSIHRKGFVIE